MRILMVRRVSGAFGYITDGMVNALRSKGHEVKRFDGEMKTWDEFDPDVYIGCSGHRENIPIEGRRAKVAIHVNPYGPVSIPGGINESQESVDWVKKQKPDVVFGYGFDEDAILWSYWHQRANTRWIPMPTAADATIFSDLNLERKNQIIYLGGRWTYKAKTIDSYLLPVLNSFRGKWKLYGWGDWPEGMSSGELPQHEVNEFYNTGRVAPCISEIHTHTHNIDIPERVFKACLAGCLPIHDTVPVLSRVIPGLPVAKDPNDFLALHAHYLAPASEKELKEKSIRLRDYVFKTHTYHQRLYRLLHGLGFPADANGLIL